MSKQKQKGTAFETLITQYLNKHLPQRIERRTLSGKHDKGDITGITTQAGAPIVAECKNHQRTDLAGWARETEQERINDNALAGIIIHKRHRKGQAEDQWVTMPLADFVSILTGKRPTD